MANTIYGEISFRLQLHKATATQNTVDKSKDAIEADTLSYNIENDNYNMTMTYSFSGSSGSYDNLNTGTGKGVYMRTISTDGYSTTDEVYPDGNGSPSGLRMTNLSNSNFDINSSFEPDNASELIRIVSIDKTSGGLGSGDFITHSNTITQFIKNSARIGNLDTSGVEDIFSTISNHDTNFHFISLESVTDPNTNKWNLILSSGSSSTISEETKYFDTHTSNSDKNTLYIIKEEGSEYRVYKLSIHSSLGPDGHVSFTSQSGPNCMGENTKVLCLTKDLKEEQIPVKDLRPGDIVKTYKQGYRKINQIAFQAGLNDTDSKRKTNARFVLRKTEENGLTEDLYVSARHLILVDKLTPEQEKNEIETFTKTFNVMDKSLVQARHHPDFEMVEEPGYYLYYQMTLENDGDIHQRHGIWTNGYLTETTCEHDFETHLRDMTRVK